jgi:hypothetical protein
MAASSEDYVAKRFYQSYAHIRVYMEGKNRLEVHRTELKERNVVMEVWSADRCEANGNGRQEQQQRSQPGERPADCRDVYDKRTQVTKRYALFWDITRRRVVIVYRRFGTTYRSQFHGPRVRVGKKESQHPIT